MKTFAMMILGCKVNHYEATYIREKLLQNNYCEVSFNDVADVYIVFTCCVTNTAEAKTRKFINRTKRLNKDAYVVIVGCYAQLKKEELNDYELVVGSDQKEKIVDYILDKTKANLVKDEISNTFENLNISSYPGRSRAFLKIQDGCNQFCSYCIIPYSRGKERSKDHRLIISEARNIAKNIKEIILTGIHTGRYNDGEYDLYTLLKELLSIKEIETIRLSSIEINELNDELIYLFKDKKMGKNIHIPIQSLNNETLKMMNRPYDYEYYLNRINYIRNIIPGISISTDLIVGFPGESEELFELTLKRLKEINFSFIHVFPYAKKAGTKADLFDNQILNSIKKERVNKIIETQKEITLKYHQSFINKTVNVLIEENKNEKSYGYSKEYIYVEINGIHNIGNIINVKIIYVDNERVIGEYVT